MGGGGVDVGVDAGKAARNAAWVKSMPSTFPPERLDSRIPADHPLKSVMETVVIDALGATEGWTCQILASSAVTIWLVEFKCVGDGHKESFFVRPAQFDDEDFRLLVAAALRHD